MSRYLKQTIFKTRFEEDEVQVALRPLEYADLVLAQGAAQAASLAGAGDDVKQQVEIIQMYSKILPVYIVSMSGLRDAAGQEVTVAEMCSAVYFMPLVMDIGNALMTSAHPANPGPPA